MNWRHTLLIGLPGVAVVGLGTYAVLFGVGVASASGNPIPCNATTNPNGTCEFEVRIEDSGLLGCLANSDYTRIEIGTTVKVGPRFSPKLVWNIDDSKAKGKYRFRDDGIQILDPFTRADDLDEEGHDDVAHKKYRWKSRNNRPGEFHFNPNVQRKVLGLWFNCDPKDPLIANAGN